MNLAVAVYRFGNGLHRMGLVRAGRVVTWLNRFLFATMIPCSASIGKRFACGYWGLGVVIHSRAVIGDDCTIAQNVTIGRNLGDERVPVIGSRVYIGAGAVVIGEISVGDDAVIGANSVVNRDVPAGAVVAGIPARLIRMKPGHAEPSRASSA